MSPEWVELISTWGYWLMAFGAIIEGETFLIIGGIAAAHDLLDLPGLILLATVGCLVHDGFFFYTGRYGGTKLLAKKPKWQAPVDKVTRLLHKYDFWLIIAFRFAYGLRTVIPFALGMSKISNLKFTIFDSIGAVIWSCFFVLGGYYFGQGLMLLIEKLDINSFVKHHWLAFTIGLIILIFGMWFLMIYLGKKRRHQKKKRLELKTVQQDSKVPEFK